MVSKESIFCTSYQSTSNIFMQIKFVNVNRLATTKIAFTGI